MFFWYRVSQVSKHRDPGQPAVKFKLLRSRPRVAPIPVTVPNHDEGATGPSPLGTGEESVPFELNRRLSRLFCR